MSTFDAPYGWIKPAALFPHLAGSIVPLARVNFDPAQSAECAVKISDLAARCNCVTMQMLRRPKMEEKELFKTFMEVCKH